MSRQSAKFEPPMICPHGMVEIYCQECDLQARAKLRIPTARTEERERRKVHLAFQGNYSSRTCVGVFSDPSVADLHSDRGDVEEHIIDELADWAAKTIYRVEIDLKTGDEMRCVTENDILSEPHLRESRVAWSVAIGRSSQSRDEALKLAAEARQGWLREKAVSQAEVQERTTALESEWVEHFGFNKASWDERLKSLTQPKDDEG